jgi:hypothetical protein
MVIAIKHQLRNLISQIIRRAFGHGHRLYYCDLLLPSMI